MEFLCRVHYAVGSRRNITETICFLDVYYGFGKIHKEQGDRCGYNSGNGREPYDLSIDVLYDSIRFGSHVRGIGLVWIQDEEVGEGCDFCQELLAGAAEFLPAGSRLCGGLMNFFAFQ